MSAAMNRQAINLAPTCPRHKQREGNAPEEIAHKDLGPAFYEGPGVRPGVVKPGGGDTTSPTSTDPMVGDYSRALFFGVVPPSCLWSSIENEEHDTLPTRVYQVPPPQPGGPILLRQGDVPVVSRSRG